MTAAAVRRRFPALDGLRAVGALAVVTTHVGFQSGDAVSGPFAGVLARLDFGVAIFFVISGFLLFRPHAVAWFDGRPGPATLTYLRNRALRILPALWVAVVAAAVLLAANDAVPWTAFLRHALLVHVYFPENLVAGLTQFWSLCVEAAFYLVLPLAGRLLTRRRPTRRRVLAELAILVALVPLGAAWMASARSLGTERAGLWLPGYVGWFGIGMAFALWHVARAHGLLGPSVLDRLAALPGTVWAGAAAIYLIAATPLAGPYNLLPSTGGEAFMKSILYAAAAAGVILPAVGLGEGRVGRVLGGRVGHYLGDISYGVFCYHVIVLGLISDALDFGVFTGRFGLRLVLTLAVSIAVATASYYLMERPILRLGRRDRRYDVSPPPGSGSSTASATAPSTSA